MKRVAYTLAVLFATCAPSYAQAGAGGTWTAPPGLLVTVDGPGVTGTVNDRPIYDGHTDGNTVTFKVKTPDDRTMTFTGKVNGDEIAFTREMQIRDGDSPGDLGIWVAMAPPQFTARRVTRTLGTEIAVAVNLVKQDLKGEALLFLPHKVTRVRGVIVVIGWGLGFTVYDDPQWRSLAETLEFGLLRARISHVAEPKAGLIGPGRIPALGGADALLMLLGRLAEESGHAELERAPLLLWGHSAAGGLVSKLSAHLPQRTIAFVRYHEGPVSIDLQAATQVPALFLKGGKDTGAGAVDGGETLWKSGRSLGAPWTWAVEPEATHGDSRDVKNANDFMILWVTAVVRQRVPTDGALLRVVTDGSAWMGDHRTGEVALFGSFPGLKPAASWLPDEQSARGWRVVIGAVK